MAIVTRTRSSAVAAGGRRGARQLLVTGAWLVLAATGFQAAPDAPPDVSVSQTDGVYTVAATFTASEPASVTVGALTDYESIPRFMPGVHKSRVIERVADRVVVEQEAVAKFMMFSQRIHLTLEILEGPRFITFRDRGGRSFARYEGSWTLADADGATLVTYALVAQPSFKVPDFILRRLLKRDALQMIEQLRTEVAARVRQSVLR
jgi:carbon monoxide dehydrogenase subunit G